MPRDRVGNVVTRQLARSGTNVGANLEEAQGSHSKADFVHRMSVAPKEAREALYRLGLVCDAELIPSDRLSELTQEAEELGKIPLTIATRSRESQ